MSKLTVGSLFAGIGGFDLGFTMTGGYDIAWQIEIDDYCRKVLAKHWPDVARYGDIRECGIGRKYELPATDVLVGGFPCQPHSLAGKRNASTDERDLWPEFYRLIREIKPRYVVGENVLGLLSSESGAFFGTILRDLAQIGYDAEWVVLAASDFGAPHQRERVFLVAYPQSIGRGAWRAERNTARETIAHGFSSSELADSSSVMVRTWANIPGSVGETPTGTDSEWAGTFCNSLACGSHSMAHAASAGLPFRRSTPFATGTTQTGAGLDAELERCGDVENALNTRCENARDVSATQVSRWEEPRRDEGAGRARRSGESNPSGATQSILGRGVARVSDWLDRYHWPSRPGEQQHEWEPARVVAEKVPNRVARLKALGNAIVPQCAEHIARCILEHERAKQEAGEVA